MVMVNTTVTKCPQLLTYFWNTSPRSSRSGSMIFLAAFFIASILSSFGNSSGYVAGFSMSYTRFRSTATPDGLSASPLFDARTSSRSSEGHTFKTKGISNVYFKAHFHCIHIKIKCKGKPTTIKNILTVHSTS